MFCFVDKKLGLPYNFIAMRTLLEVQTGETVKIAGFDPETPKAVFARFALFEGQVIKCVAKPGPVVIKEKFQTIAIGKEFSKKIYVSKGKII